MWLRFFQCLLPWRRNASDADRYLADFILRYHQIADACAVIEKNNAIDAQKTAKTYMNHICQSSYGIEWWSENSDYVCQAWFIWRYLCEHGLIRQSEAPQEMPAFQMITPEDCRHQEPLLLRLDRNAVRPEEGNLFIRCVSHDAMDGLMRRLRFGRIPDGYVRKVDECAAPIESRAVQTAIALLEAGYTVAVLEKRLHQMIIDEVYEPEHRHWIRATRNNEWLQMVYPYDVPLHRYLLQMGGRWTGKQMLLHITAADRLKDVIRLYGFRTTEEAGKRIAAWEEAARQATIYRKRKRKSEPDSPGTLDLFRELLNQPVVIPEDLIDLND